MKLLQKTVPLDFDLVLHGDTHFGLATVHEKGVEKLIKWIKAEPKHRFFAHMGDAIEARAVDHPYFNIESATIPVPDKQEEYVKDLYSPIASQCVAWLLGNHERDLIKIRNIPERICDFKKMPYGSWTAKVKFTDNKGNQIFKAYLTHGMRGMITSNAKDHEQRMANMKASLKRKLVNKAGDCLIMAMGHTHKLLVVDPAERLIMADNGEDITQTYLRAGNGASSYIEPDRRWYINTGSFMKLYKVGIDSYAEVAGYDPVEIGYVVISVRKGIITKVNRVVI